MSYTLLLPNLWNQSDPNTLCPPWYKDGGRGQWSDAWVQICSHAAVSYLWILHSIFPSEIKSNVICSYIGKFEDFGMHQLQETPGWCVSMGEPKFFVNGSVYTKSWGRPQSLCASSVLNSMQMGWQKQTSIQKMSEVLIVKSSFIFSSVGLAGLALRPGNQ